ncbi:MAG TPA: FkbM family methyltransferase [Phnomibacter sp.]|nr:FkbM family methyltransferase [Phnomibacter sp.]
MKHQIKRLLQWLLGMDNYLLLFSWLSVKRTLNLGSDAELRHFSQVLSGQRGCIIDVGANIGNTTVPLAIWNTASTVHAFEPVPLNLNVLNKVIGLYRLQNIVVHNVALGESTGEINMVVPVEGRVLQQGLSHVVGTTESSHAEGLTYTVKMHRLDDIWAFSEGNNVIGIKIDVENFELEFLKGASAVIRHYRPVVYCEIWNNHKKPITMALMASLGYQCYVFRNGKLEKDDGNDNLNYFFLPDTAAAPSGILQS